jgi:hypothetical protein
MGGGHKYLIGGVFVPVDRCDRPIFQLPGVKTSA